MATLKNCLNNLEVNLIVTRIYSRTLGQYEDLPNPKNKIK
jgi:hypothetical protein